MRKTQNVLDPRENLQLELHRMSPNGQTSGSESGLTRLKNDSVSASFLAGFNRKSGPLSHMLDIKVFAGIDLEAWSAGFMSVGT